MFFNDFDAFIEINEWMLEMRKLQIQSSVNDTTAKEL